MVICAIAQVIIGILFISGAHLPEIAATTINAGGQNLNLAQGAMAFGITFIAMGVFYIIIGLLGYRGAKHPKKIGLFFWLSVIGAVLAVTGLIYNLVVVGSVAPASIFMTVVVVICAILANIIRNNRAGGKHTSNAQTSSTQSSSAKDK